MYWKTNRVDHSTLRAAVSKLRLTSINTMN